MNSRKIAIPLSAIGKGDYRDCVEKDQRNDEVRLKEHFSQKANQQQDDDSISKYPGIFFQKIREFAMNSSSTGHLHAEEGCSLCCEIPDGSLPGVIDEYS